MYVSVLHPPLPFPLTAWLLAVICTCCCSNAFTAGELPLANHSGWGAGGWWEFGLSSHLGLDRGGLLAKGLLEENRQQSGA